MKKGGFVISFVFFVLIGYTQNQDITFAVSASTQVFQSTKFMESKFQPKNSYFTYHEKNKGEGVINKGHIFNAYSLGALISYNFRKSTVSIEPQYFMQRSVFKFQKEYYSERAVGMKAFRLPIFYSYRLFKKKNSMFFTLGTVLSIAKHYDFQHPGNPFLFSDGPLYHGGVDYGDYHFNTILYTNDNYWQNFIGLGKNIGNYKLNFRLMSRTKKGREEIAANIWQVEMSVSYHIIGVSDFKKKRKIYHE